MFAIFLPVMALFFSFVVDGGHMFLEKRSIQNAADSAALAAAQELGPGLDPSCDAACQAAVEAQIQAVATEYSNSNGGPDVDHRCADRDANGDPDPLAVEDYNCWTWPWKGSVGLVEVKLRAFSSHFVLNTWFLKNLSSAPARAVASIEGITDRVCDTDLPPGDEPCGASPPTVGTPDHGEGAHCVFDPPLPPDEDPNDYLANGCLKEGLGAVHGEVVAGDFHCVFAGEPPVSDPDQYLPDCRIPGFHEGGISGAQAFTMSRECDAIYYTGTPVTGQGVAPVLGAFATNGGLTFEGSRNKRLEVLGFDKSRCGSLLPEPPNNDPAACDQAAQNRVASCVRRLVDFTDEIPINWPVPPPPLPTPLPAGAAWNPAIHYPGACVLLTPPVGSNVVTVNALPGPPGIYCVSGPDTLLQITNSMVAGDGYTFFALDGAKIGISSNNTSVRFYWPSECGPRPIDRPLSFTCFGRDIVGYDPRTVLYSTSVHSPATARPELCTDAAICFNGSGGSLEGDVFAPHPLSFPPAIGQYGGTVWMAGGSAAAGNGFIESWNLVIQGNSGTYNGTGPIVGGTIVPPRQGSLVQDLHCVFDPPVDDPDQYLPNCVIPGEGGQQGELVPGENPTCDFGDHEVDDPAFYYPDCIIPGGDPTGQWVDTVIPGAIGMDE